jgi:hypothetical protein
MPNGLWRGKIVRVDDRGVYVQVPRLNSQSYFGPAEGIPDVTLSVGDDVLCGFFESSANQIEVIRKTFSPTVVVPPGGHQPGFFNATFGANF